MVNVDRIYQRVLALANKEQRGYITPQEFNLLANHAQMDIFEQYFYDLNQFSRMNGNDTLYADMISVIEEKLSMFHESRDIASDGEVNSTQTDPSVDANNVFDIQARLDDEDENVKLYRPLSMRVNLIQKPHIVRPAGRASIATRTFERNQAPPRGSDIGNGSGATQTSASEGPTNARQPNIIQQPPPKTRGAEIERLSHRQVMNAIDSPLTAPTITRPIYYLRSSFEDRPSRMVVYPETINYIEANFVRKPNRVRWGFVMGGDAAMFDDARSNHFELHESEETELVVKILSLAGITIKDQGLYQIAAGEDVKNIQQEKQ